MKSSPLAPTLLSSADRGTADVIALVSRRHKPVRGTHLPVAMTATDVRAALGARAIEEMGAWLGDAIERGPVTP